MRYSKEFKIEAIKRSQNEPVIKVAKDLHISEKSIYRWRKELPIDKIKTIEAEKKKTKPKKVKTKTERIAELEDALNTSNQTIDSKDKLIKELQEENEFLKKASAFFARNLKINS